jgi:hypothetical protein
LTDIISDFSVDWWDVSTRAPGQKIRIKRCGLERRSVVQLSAVQCRQRMGSECSLPWDSESRSPSPTYGREVALGNDEN